MTLTPKQEAFALAYIETGNASEAYRRTYDAAKMKDATVNRKAKELLDNGKITARVDELKAQHAERHGVTVDDIAAMLREDREFARKCETPAAAVSATMGLAKLYGHLKDRHEHTGKDGKDLPTSPAVAIFALPDNGRNG
ncbi:terminase small subunit [Novosphingobium sp. FSY-8]|uniref:Terminase small subunit n=1 Tax=Novosphingobium ovatum TaxID=1908523 RepID=A0ABW9XFL7_9SPHN|nr:terminase small subunit [Novosphingobium ovatum]NBC37350.1 terminase small subunit [Novosphingobium ovatum]